MNLSETESVERADTIDVTIALYLVQDYHIRQHRLNLSIKLIFVKLDDVKNIQYQKQNLLLHMLVSQYHRVVNFRNNGTYTVNTYGPLSTLSFLKIVCRSFSGPFSLLSLF